MSTTVELLLHQGLNLAIVLGLSLAISFLAWKKGFYQLPVQKHAGHTQLGWRHVFGMFGVFLAVELVIVPILYWAILSIKQGALVSPENLHADSEAQGWINLAAIVCTAAALALSYFYLGKSLRKEIWGAKDGASPMYALLMGAISWVVAYPWVIVISQFIEAVMQWVYLERPSIDQVAVKHLKDTLSNPPLLLLTIIGIVIVVPILEEFLFRGMLQGWLRTRMSTVKAIAVTAAVFALFHFSTTQGNENIELLAALFILGSFLGLLRENQDSLWASIGLHSTFNAISIAMILMNL
jgi:uncharacterized protein